MANYRWTMQELKTFSNKRMILTLISERRSNLNPYGPLSRRLNELARWVEKHMKG